MTRKASESFRYHALKYSQRSKRGSPEFLVFHAPAADIVRWAEVDRLAPDNPTGAQRPLRDLKVNKVGKFLKADPANTIPTSVVVAIDPKNISFAGRADESGVGEQGVLDIRLGRTLPGLIIDGQHRVFGALKFYPDMHLNVVAILGDDDSERAFQFVVINNSATRISKDHIKALNLNYDQEELNSRLLLSSGLGLGIETQRFDDLQAIDALEPFKGLLKWPTNDGGFIPPNAIESALAETYERAALLGVEELELDLFLAIWSEIKSIRGSVWNNTSRLLHKVSIYALTVYVLDSMISRQRNDDVWVDFTDESVLRAQVNRVVGRIPEAFWSTEWTAKELDTGHGRQRLVETLQVIDSNVRFKRTWYDRVGFVDPALLISDTHRTGKTTSKSSKAAKRDIKASKKKTPAKKVKKLSGKKPAKATKKSSR